MNPYKLEILAHYNESIEFVRSLSDLKEEEWRTPIAEGKWTVAEIIGHFLPWDNFILNQRLPYLFSGEELPKGPSAQETNARAAAEARNDAQAVTINKFVSMRQALCEALEAIPDERWERSFTIGKTTLTLYEYLKGLAEHDNHHFSQIRKALSLF